MTAHALIPIWVIVIVIACALPTFFKGFLRIYRWLSPVKAESVAQSAPAPMLSSNLVSAPAPNTVFTPNEEAILRLLAENSGGPLLGQLIAGRIQQNTLRTEQALDSLMHKGLVQETYSYTDPTRYYLTPKGRDIVIELGFA
jgi:predicted transcriptional regulator